MDVFNKSVFPQEKTGILLFYTFPILFDLPKNDWMIEVSWAYKEKTSLNKAGK